MFILLPFLRHLTEINTNLFCQGKCKSQKRYQMYSSLFLQNKVSRDCWNVQRQIHHKYKKSNSVNRIMPTRILQMPTLSLFNSTLPNSVIVRTWRQLNYEKVRLSLTMSSIVNVLLGKATVKKSFLLALAKQLLQSC